MNSTSSTLDFCLRKDLGIYLCLYWDYSMCRRVYPCLLVSDTMDVLPGIVNTLYLSDGLRGVLVIPVTGAGELGLYNHWRWLPYLSFPCGYWIFRDLTSGPLGKGISLV